MHTVAAFEAAMAPFSPQYVSEVLRTNRELAVEAAITTTLLAQGRTKRVGNRNWNWNTADLPARTTTVNNGGAAYDGTTTSIVLTSAANFRPNDLALCEASGEVMYISAISTNTATVVRGIGSANGGVAAGATGVANTAVIRRLGPAMGEASPVPADFDFGSTTFEQTIQTFKTAISSSGLASVLDSQVESPQAFNRAQGFQQFMRDIEMVALFGGRVKTGLADAGGRNVLTSQGLYNAITTNRFPVNGTMTRAYFEGTVMAQLFARGSTTKYCFYGPTFGQTLMDLYRTNSTKEEAVEVAGVRYTRIKTVHGELLLMPNRALSGTYAGDAVIIDMTPEVSWRYTEGVVDGKPRMGLPNLVPVVQTNGTDAQTEYWFAEGGIQWGAQSLHALVRGVTAAA